MTLLLKTLKDMILNYSRKRQGLSKKNILRINYFWHGTYEKIILQINYFWHGTNEMLTIPLMTMLFNIKINPFYLKK
jgi:hypothetical protein